MSAAPARQPVPPWRGLEPLATQRGISLSLALFGLLALEQQMFPLEAVTRAWPGLQTLGALVPVLFIACGTACGLASQTTAMPTAAWSWPERASRACAGGVLLSCALGLLAHALPLPASWSPALEAALPLPVALAFACASSALLLSLHGGRGAQRAMAVSIVLTTLIGLLALMGHYLRLGHLYRLAAAMEMPVPVAVGLLFLSLALWLVHDHTHLARAGVSGHMARITQRSIAVLSLVAAASGVAGFGVLRDSFEHNVTENLRLTTSTNATAMRDMLNAAMALPFSLLTRSELADLMAGAEATDSPQRRATMQRLADAFVTAGMDGVELRGADDRLLAQSGLRVAERALTREPLKAERGQAFLLWREGYLLEMQIELRSAGRTVGHLQTEQRLRALDRVLSALRATTESTDAVLCTRSGNEAFCAPSRFYSQPIRVPMFNRDGEPSMPVNRALLGEGGVRTARDLRGIDVAAGYQPVAAGVALVVKTDLDTLYAPLKQQINLLVLLLVALVAAGTYALRLRVRPLLGQIVAEQQRIAVILDNSHDAFIALGSDGTVTAWNHKAELTFGWPAEQALGRHLTELIIPPALREAHEQGFARFLHSGTGPVLNRLTEVTALHRDGRSFAVELSIAAYHDGQGLVSNAFVRDISARKAAEAQLASSERQLQQSERRLRSITDNLPVLISYIDADQKITFLNKTFTHWTGRDHMRALGRPVLDVIGPAHLEQFGGYLKRALAGERVSFEAETQEQGTRRDLRHDYIPDCRDDGSVAGLYTLSTDVTALKDIERKLAAQATVDALTGLANRHRFNDKLPEALARSARSGEALALMFLDVDHFKLINDNLGHAAGDAVLVELGKRLRDAVRQTDTVARLAGDEFVVILEGLHSAAEPQFVARKILNHVSRPFVLEGCMLDVSISIGVAYQAQGQTTPDELLSIADKALYEAKAAGRNTYAITGS